MAESRKKVILMTIITSILLIGLIIFLFVMATKKPANNGTAQISVETSETDSKKTGSDKKDSEKTKSDAAGRFVLEEEKVEPTSASIATAETSTTETSSELPKTGATDLFAFALLAGSLTTYLLSLRLKNNEA